MLESKHPSYGPDHKAAFLRWVPLDSIQQFTGCRLRPESAQFEVRRRPDPERRVVSPGLEWVLKGAEPATGKLKEAECTATFEPFEGHMTALDGRSKQP